MISNTPHRSFGMQEAFLFSCTFIHCSTFNHLLYTQNRIARVPETRRSADRFPSYEGRLSVANVLVLRTPEMMISSGGVSLSLKICASSLCVQRYDSPFTPRFCLAGRNPRFCGRKAPAVRIRFRRRLNLLRSSLLANVRDIQTLWAAACLQLIMTTLLVLCCCFFWTAFSLQTQPDWTGKPGDTFVAANWHKEFGKRTSRAFDHDETDKNDFKAHVGPRESVEWQHCRGGAGRHTAYTSINEVLFAYLNGGTARNVILQGSTVPPTLALRRWGVSLSLCSLRADSTLQNRANPNWLLPQLK